MLSQLVASLTDSGRVGLMEKSNSRIGRSIKKRIAILVYEKCSFVDIGLLVETFNLANAAASAQYGETAHYSTSLLSSDGGRVQFSNSIEICTASIDGSSHSGYDALFIAGGEGASIAAKDRRTTDWLMRACRGARVVRAAGNGTLLLQNIDLPIVAETVVSMQTPGGQHTLAKDEALAVDRRAMSPFITALSIIKSDFGYDTAESIADRLMPFSGRWLRALMGDPPGSNAATKIKEASRWVEDHYDRPIAVSDMAKSVSMGERTFLRHFTTHTGMSPSAFLLLTRLNIACMLLLTNYLIYR